MDSVIAYGLYQLNDQEADFALLPLFKIRELIELTSNKVRTVGTIERD